MRFQESLNGAACRRRPHLLEILDGVHVLNHLDELFIDRDVVLSHRLTVFQWNPDAELVKLILLIRVELPMLECSIILLKVVE